MKKLCLIAMAFLFFAGCGILAQESEFYEHDSMYKDLKHLVFSCYKYKNPTKETGRQSRDGNWWGIDIPGPALE